MAVGSCRFYVLLESAKNTLYGLLLERNLCRQLNLSTSYISRNLSYFDSTILPFGKRISFIVGKTTRNTTRKTATSFTRTGR